MGWGLPGRAGTVWVAGGGPWGMRWGRGRGLQCLPGGAGGVT